MESYPSVSVNNLSLWWLAVRPRTLWASLAPVIMGTAMAYGDGVYHWGSALASLGAALLLQAGANLANDFFDAKSGVDQLDRRGPCRVTQGGLLPPYAVFWGFTLSFLAAGGLCTYLVLRAGLPALIIAVLSMAAGLLYTAGPWPLSHKGWGEALALIFFGPVALAGTYFVQSFEWNPAIITAGFGPGLFSCAIMAINNLRDIDTDARAGKRTLAVRFGRKFARTEYLFCVFAAAFIPALVYVITNNSPWLLLAGLIPFFLGPVIHDVYTTDDGPTLNKALAATAVALLIYAVVFSCAWII